MIILLCFSSWYLNFVCGCRCLSDFTVDHTVKFSGIASDGHTWTLKSHSYTKFDLGQYSWLFLDFTTKISRRKVRVLPQHSPSHNVHVSFLSMSAGLAVTLLLFTTSNRLSTVICFVSTDRSSKKTKIHDAGKTKKDNTGQILFCLTMLYIQKSCLKSVELL